MSDKNLMSEKNPIDPANGIDADLEALSFEEALAQLEQVVRQLENGELSLDQSLAAFRKGSELSKLCRQKLNEVERSITKLVTTDEGEVQEEAFPEMNDE